MPSIFARSLSVRLVKMACEIEATARVRKAHRSARTNTAAKGLGEDHGGGARLDVTANEDRLRAAPVSGGS